MSELNINILSALAVSVIITAMARVHSQKHKAIMYTLPFPITIALIGSNSVATSLSILGLILTGSFLWGCYFLHFKMDVKVLYTDVILSILYVVAAYILAQSVNVSFWIMFTIFVLAWLLLMALFKKTTFSYRSQTPTKTNLWLKAVTVFVIAFALFSTHQYLAAFVVTFPYNGVFAVYENKAGLLPQAALFTRNSLALAAYFLANYLVGTQYAAPVRYAASWLAFGVVLVLANWLIKVRIKDTRPATKLRVV
jgi:hypothetical protein